MKHIVINTMVLAAFMGSSAAAMADDGNTGYLHSIAFNNSEVEKVGRKVRFSVGIDLSETDISQQHTVSLTPVLVSKDETMTVEFPGIVIDGKTRAKVYRRAQRLESVEMPPYHEEGKTILDIKDTKDETLEYSGEVPYERWMLDGDIVIREEVHGCANCPKWEDEQNICQGVLPQYMPQYRMEEMKPTPSKVREETFTARLNFKLDSHLLLKNYKNNESELDAILRNIMEIDKNQYKNISGIYITAYASPEASEEYNKKLSQKRADALVGYIEEKTDFPEGLMHSNGHGEDWEGLKQGVQDLADFDGRERVLKVMEQYDNQRDRAEMNLALLVPPTIYERIKSELYPALRRSEYRIVYDVQKFDLAQARQIAKEEPGLLSGEEFFMVIDSYEKDSPEQERMIYAAAKALPGDEAVQHRAAMLDMKKGQARTAVERLEKAGDIAPALTNTLGVAYTETGQYQEAEKAFRKAADAGAEAARHNLMELAKVMEQL